MSTRITVTTHSLTDGWHDTTHTLRLTKSDLHTPDRPRYSVRLDGVYVGWVLKDLDGWTAYASQSVHGSADVRGRPWGCGDTRRAAIEDLIWNITRTLGKHWKETVSDRSIVR